MCIIDNDGDTCPVWREAKVRARKEHTCSCCRARIAKGEVYLAHTSMYDGYWSRECLCAPCLAARDVFCADPNHRVIPNPVSFDDILEGCIAEGDEESETKWRPLLEQIRERRGRARQPTACHNAPRGVP